MKPDARIIMSLLVLAMLAVACTPGEQPGRIELDKIEFDFGAIPNTTPVSQAFQVRNTGEGALEITGVSTSCGCTTARVDRTRLEPGEVTTLTVTYDPQAHGGETGRFTRVVYVRSDDPRTPEASLTVRVTVIDP
ncbi:MAG TPA: DUF1573 domain-containing protein [Chloroflexi bacterium]|nr:DUF1573 domain-containing protein [Chloroflexota bacterium]